MKNGKIASIVLVIIVAVAMLSQESILLSSGLTCKDINGDGQQDIADVIEIGNIIQGNTRGNGDCDGDRDTDLNDAITLTKYLFETTPTTKIEQDLNTRKSPSLGPGSTLPFCTVDLLPLYPSTIGFLRGDSNGDEMFDVADAVYSLFSLFVPGSEPSICLMLSDANGDNIFDISDPIFTLAALFTPGSPQPPAPYPDLGFDAIGWEIVLDPPASGDVREIKQVFGLSGQPEGFIALMDSAIDPDSQVYIVRIDNIGNIVWQKSIGTDILVEEGYDLQFTYDSNGNHEGYIITGTSYYGPNRNLLIIKTDLEGDTCDYTITGTCSDTTENIFYNVIDVGNFEIGRSIKQIIELGTPQQYVVAGRITDSAFQENIFLMKIDNQGSQIDIDYYGGPDDETARDVEVVLGPLGNPEGFIITGFLEQGIVGGDKDIFIIKTNLDGETCPYTFTTNCFDPSENVFVSRYGGIGPDEGYDLEILYDQSGNVEKYAVTGSTYITFAQEEDLVLLTIYPDGFQESFITHGNFEYINDIGMDIEVTYDSNGVHEGFVISGDTHNRQPLVEEATLNIIKTDTEGETCDYLTIGNCEDQQDNLFAKQYGGIRTIGFWDDLPMQSVEQVIGGNGIPNGYIIAGLNGDEEPIIIRTDNAGNY